MNIFLFIFIKKMNEYLKIAFLIYQEIQKLQLVEKIKGVWADEVSNELLNIIFEIDSKIKQYNEIHKNQSIVEIEKIENYFNKIIIENENKMNNIEQKIKNIWKNNDSEHKANPTIKKDNKIIKNKKGISNDSNFNLFQDNGVLKDIKI